MTERNFIGQVLLDNSILTETTVKPDHFINGRNRLWYKKIQSLFAAGVSVDILVLAQEFPKDAAEIAGLTNTPTTANWKYYQEKILEAYRQEKLKMLGMELRELYKDPEEAYGKIQDVINETVIDTQYKINNLVGNTYDYLTLIEERFKKQGELPGISTGIKKLDDAVLGLRESRLYYIGGRPGDGKSALVLTLASHVCIDLNHPVGLISLENSEGEIRDRLFSQRTNVNTQNIATGFIGNQSFCQIADTGEEVHNKPFYTYCKPGLTVDELVIIARNMKELYNIEILFVDYLQLIKSSNKRYNKIETVGEASVALKNIAMDLGIPVVSAVQLRRDVDNRKPGLGDGQHSSAIEQDADVIINIWHDDKDSWLCVEKNRDGYTSDIPIYFKKECVKFFEKTVDNE